MRSVIDSVLNSIKAFFAKLSKKDKIRLAVILIAIIILSVVIATVLGRTTYGVLYTNLEAADAGNVLASLEAMGIPTKTEGTGTILVPEDQVSTARMQLAASGFGSGGYGYDIFASASGFGTTEMERNTYLKYQNEANLRQTILTMEKISDCLVMINLPEESALAVSASQETASASVVLELAYGATLSNSEATAIAEIVSAGVAIPVENVRVIDTQMNVYSTGGGTEDLMGSVTYQYELERTVREQLQTQVVNLLSPVFGLNSVRASVNVTLQFDDEAVQSVEFEPPIDGETDGIAVSMYELYEYTRDDTAEGAVGTDTNGMGTIEYPYEDEDGYHYRQIVREVNYEINETVTTIQRAKGTVKNLSIAVLLDSEAMADDYTANVINLVSAALGVNDEYVSVERLPFQTDSSEYADAINAQNEVLKDMRTKEIILAIINGVVILLLVLLVISFIKTLFKGFMKPKPQQALAGGPGSSINYIADEEGELESQTHYADVELNSKPEGVKQLEKFIDKDPQAVAQLLRNWLSDDD